MGGLASFWWTAGFVLPIQWDVKTSTQSRSGQPKRVRSRHGYDHSFWGEPAPAADQEEEAGYWSVTRRPLPSLLFVIPILIAYEAGVSYLGGPAAGSVRAGADAWIRHALMSLGLTDRWLLPVGLVAGLLAWHVVEAKDWKFRPGALLGMLVESLVLAVVLIGLSKLVDLGFDRLESSPRLLEAGTSGKSAGMRSLIGFLGAGLYEETLFRLALIPVLYYGLRIVQVPGLVATTLAMTGSAFLFSMAHHAGAPGEPFTWFVFIFRWMAGVFFAWVYLARGFGVAVGTHTAYDILVGWFDWQL